MYAELKLWLACCICLVSCFSARGATSGPLSLAGDPVDPFSGSPHIRVFLFVRSDCPITNRYAPELRRIAGKFSTHHIDFWLVYPDRSESARSIQDHIAQYGLPGTPLRDPAHLLVARAHVNVAPEAAVFDRAGRLQYHGRIDDRYVDFGTSRPAAQVHDLEEAISDVLAGKPVSHPQTRAIGCSLADLE